MRPLVPTIRRVGAPGLHSHDSWPKNLPDVPSPPRTSLARQITAHQPDSTFRTKVPVPGLLPYIRATRANICTRPVFYSWAWSYRSNSTYVSPAVSGEIKHPPSPCHSLVAGSPAVGGLSRGARLGSPLAAWPHRAVVIPFITPRSPTSWGVTLL